MQYMFKEKTMARQTRRLTDLNREKPAFTSPETEEIVNRLRARTGDERLASSTEFSPTAVSMIRRVLRGEGMIIPDTEPLAASLRAALPDNTRAEVVCYLEDRSVGLLAESKHITRAEVAVDAALSRPGAKVMIIGTAPAALARLIAHRRTMPMSDVVTVATVSGFAQAVELKERLRDSGMSYIVIRGRSGGPAAADALMHSIFDTVNKK